MAGFFTQVEFFLSRDAYHFILFYLEFEIWTKMDKLDRTVRLHGRLHRLRGVETLLDG